MSEAVDYDAISAERWENKQAARYDNLTQQQEQSAQEAAAQAEKEALEAAGKLSIDDKPDENAAKLLRAQWDRYQQLYTPVEDQLIGSIGTNSIARTVGAAQNSQVRANEIERRARSRYGINPLAGAPRDAARSRSSALAQAEAFNRSSLAQYDRDQNIRTGLVDLGQSLVNQSTGGLVDAAGMQGQRETSYQNAMAQYDANKDAQMMQTVSTLGGLATMGMIAGI